MELLLYPKFDCLIQFSKKLLKQKVEEMLEKDSNVGMTKWFQDLNKGDSYMPIFLMHFAKLTYEME